MKIPARPLHGALRAAACLAALAVGSQVWSQEPAGETTPVEVLVQQLSAGSRAVRFAAEQSLIQRGEVVLEALPDPQADSDPALREAVTRIRRQVATNAANAILDQGGMMVPDSVRTCLDVIAFLNSQIVNVIEIGVVESLLAQTPRPDRLEQGTFLELLDGATLASRAGWRWIPGTRRIELTRIPEAELARPRHAPVYAHGCRVFLADVKEQRNYVDPQQRKLFRAVLTVDVEPRLRPFWLTVAEGDFTAGDQEQRLSLLNPDARREMTPQGGRFQFPVDFGTPVNDVPEAIDVSGRVAAHLAVRPTQIAFTRQDAAPKQVGEMELKLREWAESDHVRATLLITFSNPAPELESHRQGLLHRDVFLRTAEGVEWNPRSVNLRSADGLTHVVEYEFPPGIVGPDMTLVYVAPTLITDAVVDFHFKAVALPK